MAVTSLQSTPAYHEVTETTKTYDIFTYKMFFVPFVSS